MKASLFSWLLSVQIQHQPLPDQLYLRMSGGFLSALIISAKQMLN